jgi:HD-like signal output (HDOD) protein
MAGLVCDVGELILTSDPDASANAADDGALTQMSSVTHAEAGAFLLGLWGLPYRIVEAVANHHAPLRNAHDRLGLPQIVWLAACLVQKIEPDPEYLVRIGAAELLPELKGMVVS